MAVDLLLGAILITLAGCAIFARRLLACVLLFIAFGLLVSLAWARLGAIDLALAEAAIGAGLTGTLLLYALVQSKPDTPVIPRQKIVWFAAAGFALLACFLILQALPHIASRQETNALPSAGRLTHLHLQNSGVGHPVTAVLLNFRAWDTLLELAVVLLALVGIRQLRPSAPITTLAPWPLLAAWSKILAPILFVVAAYLLWRGKSAPGGAFQAGAMLAAAAVLLRLTGVLPALPWSSLGLRGLSVLGLGLFVAIGLSGFWLGDGWLHLPLEYSGVLILSIETAATVSVALALSLMIIGDEGDLHS